MIPDVDEFFTISNSEDIRDKPKSYTLIYLKYLAGVTLIPTLLGRINFQLNPSYYEDYMKDNELDTVRQAYLDNTGQTLIFWGTLLLGIGLFIFIITTLLFKRDQKRVRGRINIQSNLHSPPNIRISEKAAEDYEKKVTWKEKNPTIAYFLAIAAAGTTSILIGILLINLV